MNTLIDWLIGWPERVARHLEWLAPLFARITVGYVFMLTGWGKLHNLPEVVANFTSFHPPGSSVSEICAPLEKALSASFTRIEMSQGILKKGSSKHGNARRASMGVKVVYAYHSPSSLRR